MNNIFINAGIKRNFKEFGKLIRVYDIIEEYKNKKEDLKECEYNIEIPDNLLENKYLYLLCVYCIFKPEYGRFICEDDIVYNYYLSEEEAKQIGLNLLNKSFNKFECTEDYEIYKYIDYNFSITQIYTKRHPFKSDNSRMIYYKENLNKMDLYELLLDISGGYKLSCYDYKGNLIGYDKILSDHYNSFSFKSLLGYHTNKFNIGDKVRFRYANDKTIGTVVGKYDNIGTIYDSNDPYHFKEGYNIEYTIDGYTTYNENWQEPYYDEDLELIK